MQCGGGRVCAAAAAGHGGVGRMRDAVSCGGRMRAGRRAGSDFCVLICFHADGMIWPHGLIDYTMWLGRPHVKIYSFPDTQVHTVKSSARKNHLDRT